MASKNTQPLQGMEDIGGPEVYLWQSLEDTARRIFHLYGFSEIRTPIPERTGIFTHTIGDATDIVQKEMYTFEDRGGRSVTLRPEGTAGVVRYLMGLGQEARDARLYYMGPMYRAERPQAGRKRQFHQCGVEMVGDANYLADAECIALQLHLLEEWGLTDCNLLINTRGERGESEQIADELRNLLQPRKGELCDDCQRRLDSNVLRILDCKRRECQKVVDSLPPLTELMKADSREYFERLRATLKELGVDATVDPRLVRGLDYYAHTVWEITHPALGAQDALAGGGRYEIESGKNSLAGVGFAMGMERVLMALKSVGVEPDENEAASDVWLVSMGERALKANMALEQDLRYKGIACNMDLHGRSMKAQMRAANRSGARKVVIRGDDEIERDILVLKDMVSGEQFEVDSKSLMDRLLT